MNTSHPTPPFLETLFSQVPGHLQREIRVLGSDRRMVFRSFSFLRDLQTHGFERIVPFDLDGSGDVYFGMVPRVKAGRGGNEKKPKDAQ